MWDFRASSTLIFIFQVLEKLVSQFARRPTIKGALLNSSRIIPKRRAVCWYQNRMKRAGRGEAYTRKLGSQTRLFAIVRQIPETEASFFEFSTVTSMADWRTYRCERGELVSDE